MTDADPWSSGVEKDVPNFFLHFVEITVLPISLLGRLGPATSTGHATMLCRVRFGHIGVPRTDLTRLHTAALESRREGDTGGEGCGREDVLPVPRFPSHPEVLSTRDPPRAGAGEDPRAGGAEASTAARSLHSLVSLFPPHYQNFRSLF